MFYRSGILLAAALLAVAPPARSDEIQAVPQAEGAVDDGSPTVLWDGSISAGISARDDGPDGSWQSLSVARNSGRTYVRGTLMRYHGTLLQADTALPSDYYVGTLGAGGNFGNWVADGWVSYGRQQYGQIRTSSGRRPSSGARSSTYLAVGGDWGRIVPLGTDFYLTPTVAGSFAYGRLLRPAPSGSGVTDQETDEPTWSGNLAIRVDHAFGRTHAHYAGLSISRNWTSNGVSALRLRYVPESDGPLPWQLDSKHYADSWFEIGATANLELSRQLHLDFFASRSSGVRAGNVSTAGLTLRKSF